MRPLGRPLSCSGSPVYPGDYRRAALLILLLQDQRAWRLSPALRLSGGYSRLLPFLVSGRSRCLVAQSPGVLILATRCVLLVAGADLRLAA